MIGVLVGCPNPCELGLSFVGICLPWFFFISPCLSRFFIPFCVPHKHNLMIYNYISGKNTTVVGGRPVHAELKIRGSEEIRSYID